MHSRKTELVEEVMAGVMIVDEEECWGGAGGEMGVAAMEVGCELCEGLKMWVMR